MTDLTPRRRTGFTLTQTLLIGFGSLTVLSVLAVLALGIWAALRNTADFVRDRGALSVELLTAQIVEHLQPTEDAVGQLADLIAQGRIDIERPTEIAAMVRGVLASAPQLRNFGFVSREARVTGGMRTAQGIVLLDSEQVVDPIIRAAVREMSGSERAEWLGPVWREQFGGAVLIYRKPVRRDGVFLGAVVALVHIRDLSAFVERAGRQLGGNAFVLVQRRQVLAHRNLVHGHGGSDEAPIPRIDRINDPVLARVWDVAAMREPPVRVPPPLINHNLRVGNDTHFIVYRELHRFGPHPWQVGVHVGFDAIAAETRRLVLSGVAGLAALALALFSAMLIGRRIARPVGRIADAARLIGEMRVAEVKPLPGSRIRELNDQSGAFNTMVRGLRWFEAYVPKTLVRHILAGGDDATVSSDNRHLTVMFTDIVGFSGWAEGRPAAEVAAFLNRHFGLVAACIEAEGGTIDKFIGDAVMAFWGAPQKQKNRAERACRAALAMRAALAEDNRERVRRGEAPVGIRVGIHSGEATVGNIGSPDRLNYTVIGDMVNVANRLEQLAKTLLPPRPDTASVLISEATLADLGPGFRTRPLGQQPIRGRAETLAVFELVAGPAAGDAAA
jgi:class 3 adenylate cyclase